MGERADAGWRQPRPGTGRPVVASEDPGLLDEVLRLSAAVGVEVEVAGQVAAVRARWGSADLVMVDAALAQRLVDGDLPRRADLVLVATTPPDDRAWQAAVALGAERVLLLPDDERWLVDRLGDVLEGPPRQGPVLAVVGGRGGAGASTLAAALAVVSARTGARTLLVDADPWGGGLDLLLGGEDEPGLRWPDLAATRGRLAAASLGEALPRPHGVTVLSWGREPLTSASVEAVAAVVDAGRRGFDRTVVDVSRALDDTARVVLARADRTLIVVPAEVRAVAASARVLDAVRQSCPDVRLVVRGGGRLDPVSVAEALDVPLAGVLPAERGLPGAADRGEPPASQRRSRLARAVERMLAATAGPPRTVPA